MAVAQEVSGRDLGWYFDQVLYSPDKLDYDRMARLVDGILLVVRSGSTKREIVEDVVEKLGRDKILGVVANWVDERVFAYYGKGQYAQYGSYYQQA